MVERNVRSGLTGLIELVDEYVEHQIRTGRYRLPTATMSRRTLRRWVRAIGTDRDPRTITANDVEDWAASRPAKPATRRHQTRVVAQFLAWMVETRRLSHHPMPPTEPPARGELGRLVEQYVDRQIRAGRFAGATPKSVRCVLLAWARDVGDDRAPSSIDRADIEGWIVRQRVTPATLRRKQTVVRGFLDWLVDTDQIDRNPMAGLKPPRQPQAIPRALKVSQVRHLIQGLPDARARLIVSLMVQEGLRCAEVAGLQLGAIDFTEKLALVTGKGGHQRVLPVSEETWTALGAWLEELPGDRTAGPLIRSLSTSRLPGQPITPGYLSNLVAEWFAAAGIKKGRWDGNSGHALRHTCATDLVKRGAHIRDVQAALGHRSIVTTQRYLAWASAGELRVVMAGRSYR